MLNKTGLKGSYDLTLEYRRANPQMFTNEAAAIRATRQRRCRAVHF
jgi:hypothetical protein